MSCNFLVLTQHGCTNPSGPSSYLDSQAHIPELNGASSSPSNIQLLKVESVGVYELKTRQSIS